MSVDDSLERARPSRVAAAIKQRRSIDPYAALAVLVLLFSILITLENVLAIGFQFERNYNEGWNVYNAERLIQHELVYDDDYWRVNNYPIGSFLIIAGINRLVHDLLLSGRIVALLSFAAIGILAAIAVRRFGGERIDAIFGAGCALGFCYLIAPAWIIVDDPQTLGEAAMMAGLVSYLSDRAGRLGLLRTAFLVVLAVFIKHNVLSIPVAITLDLALCAPRRLPLWLGCCAIFAASLLGLTQIVAGGVFIEHLLSPRIFAWYGTRYHLMKYVRLFKLPLVAMVLGCRLVFPAHRFVLAAWGLTSICLATIFSGFEGASYNMFQDAAVFLGVAAGVMLWELRKAVVTSGRFAGAIPAVVALVLAQPILTRTPSAVHELSHPGALMEANHRAEESFLADARYISDAHGPAICESLLLCHTAGRPFTLDPFNSRQYILAGKLDETQLIQDIAAHEFAVIQVRADICDDPVEAACHILHYPQKFNRFTDETLYAIDRYYRIDRRSRYGVFYVPK
jgi:hypothetical protein